VITLRPFQIAIEFIYTTGQKAIDAYSGSLTDDLDEVRKRLDSFSQSPTPQNRLRLEQTAAPFISKSLKAFANDYVEQVDWDFLVAEFRTTKHPDLADIARLFSEPDSIENRALILLRLWKKVSEIAAFTIRDPSDPVDTDAFLKRWNETKF
jgi:hypothetical protein